tara:strand:+ start:960 stop:1067 length:108 start_codon:yes stop_codon:yes gene_type:complete
MKNKIAEIYKVLIVGAGIDEAIKFIKKDIKIIEEK